MTMDKMQAVADIRAQHPALTEPGPYGVWGPEDGESYWLPQPSGGHMTLKMTPDAFPANRYMAAIQVIEEGGVLRDHGHREQDEFLFVFEGRGTVYIDGVAHGVEPGSLVFVGRYRNHGFVNDGPGPMKIFFMTVPAAGVEDVVRLIGRPRAPDEPAPEPFERPDDPDIGRQLDLLADVCGIAHPDEMPPGGTGHHHRV